MILALSQPGPNVITSEMVRRMKDNTIIFTLANPIPEISYGDAKAAGAAVVATRLSDYPNQVNDILSMPAIFRGVLDVGASSTSSVMLKEVAQTIAVSVEDHELNEEYILPRIGRGEMVARIAETVVEYSIKAKEINVKRKLLPKDEYDNVKVMLESFR